jgi:hypothetical protein
MCALSRVLMIELIWSCFRDMYKQKRIRKGLLIGPCFLTKNDVRWKELIWVMRDETMVEMGNFITVCNGFNGGGSLISEWRGGWVLAGMVEKSRYSVCITLEEEGLYKLLLYFQHKLGYAPCINTPDCLAHLPTF